VTIDEAITQLRADPDSTELVRDAYLGRDVSDSARRFAESGEFAEIRSILDGRIEGAIVVDIGAGTGIASMAFLDAGASRVIAIEPDPSDEVGRAAIRRLDSGGRIEVIDAYGENLPIASDSVDIVYARQVLHHADDLPALLRECARVLRAGAMFMACREHVVDNDRQLRAFLRDHPVHRLAGGENAYPLSDYRSAIDAAGLELVSELGPTESIINAFPAVRTTEDMPNLARRVLERRLGWVGRLAASLPGAGGFVKARMSSAPGRLFTFIARKP
jgi:SAM-dependent methyltransferase